MRRCFLPPEDDSDSEHCSVQPIALRKRNLKSLPIDPDELIETLTPTAPKAPETPKAEEPPADGFSGCVQLVATPPAPLQAKAKSIGGRPRGSVRARALLPEEPKQPKRTRSQAAAFARAIKRERKEAKEQIASIEPHSLCTSIVRAYSAIIAIDPSASTTTEMQLFEKAKERLTSGHTPSAQDKAIVDWCLDLT